MANAGHKDMPAALAEAIFAARRKVADHTLAVSQAGKALKQARKDLNEEIDAAYEAMFEMPLFDAEEGEGGETE